MSSNVHTASHRNYWHPDLVASQSLQGDPGIGDPGIDDPVNDTGLGPRHCDLQVSREFAS
jgi:hypothetical protein